MALSFDPRLSFYFVAFAAALSILFASASLIGLHHFGIRFRWLAFPVAMVVFVGSYYASGVIAESEHRAVLQASIAGGNTARELLEQRLSSDTKALARLAGRMQSGLETDRDLWEKDALNIYRDGAEYQAIEWIDPHLQVDWVTPLKGNEGALRLNLTFESRRRNAVNTARYRGKLTVSRTFDLIQGGRGFLIYAPVVRDHKFAGMVAGVVNVKRFVNTLPAEWLKHHSTRLWDGGALIYANAPTDVFAPGVKAETEVFSVNSPWRLEIAPTPETIGQWLTPIPRLILFFGTILSVFAGILVLMWERSSQLDFKDRQSKNALDEIIEMAPNGMAILEIDGKLLRVNAALCTLVGYSAEELLGRQIQSITHPEDAGTKMEPVEKILRGEARTCSVDRRLITKDGNELSIVHSLAVLRDLDGNPKRLVTQILDITERKRDQDRIERYSRELEAQKTELALLAGTDHLTGVANRRAFLEKGADECKRAQRYNREMCFLMLDIDHFKLVNDTYGHAAGDEVLRTFAKTMESAIRPSDLLGRLGGEEFAIMLPETTLKDAMNLAQRLRRTVASLEVRHDDHTIRLTISIGVASFSPGDQIETFLQLADSALYEAKQTGRNRVVMHHPLRVAS